MNVVQKGRNMAAMGAATVAGMALTAPAWAGDLADAITTEIATAKAEILLVGVAVMGIVGVLLLIRSVRRAAG